MYKLNIMCKPLVIILEEGKKDITQNTNSIINCVQYSSTDK